MNSKENLEFLLNDIYGVLKERKDESDESIKNNKDDLFESGRNLAYFEIMDIIQNRLDVYDIKLN